MKTEKKNLIFDEDFNDKFSMRIHEDFIVFIPSSTIRNSVIRPYLVTKYSKRTILRTKQIESKYTKANELHRENCGGHSYPYSTHCICVVCYSINWIGVFSSVHILVHGIRFRIYRYMVETVVYRAEQKKANFIKRIFVPRTKLE